MPVILRSSGELPAPEAYDVWFAVTGAKERGAAERKLPELGSRLEAAFDHICPDWWDVAAALSGTPGAELAYATTASAFGSDFGLMMAWGRLVRDVAEEARTCLVVCNDPWLFRHLAALPGVEAGKAPRLWPAAVKLKLRGMAARLRLMARLSWAAVATRRHRGTTEGGFAILVYGHPDSTADGDDVYFGPMMREVPALKRVLHTDCRPGRAAALAADGRTVSLHAWGRPWRTPGLMFQRWRPGPEHLRGPYGWLVRRAAEIEAGGAAHAMNAWQHQCQEAWLVETRPAVVAWPWENHGWERAFCRAAGRLGVATVGYQHTVIGRHQLNYSPATNRDGEMSLPDTVVCDGPAYRDQLADWGIPARRLVIGGSLRIQRPDGVNFDPDGPCFVALSADLGIAHQQMDAVAAAAIKGFVFVVKEHPMYPLDFEETDRIRRTGSAMVDQPALAAVFYATGTSGLEALLAGLPTFRLQPEDEIAIDVLPSFISAVAVTADGLADALASSLTPPIVDWNDVLAPVDWPLWQRLLGAGEATETDSNAEKSSARGARLA